MHKRPSGPQRDGLRSNLTAVDRSRERKRLSLLKVLYMVLIALVEMSPI